MSESKSDDQEKTRDYRTAPRGVKHEDRELLLPLFPIILYSLPAVWVAASLPMNWKIELIGGILIIGVSSLVFYSIRGEWDLFPKSGEWAPEEENEPELDLANISFEDGENRETLRVEYQELCEEARYRDRLLLQTGYFALAVIGLMGGIFANVPSSVQPFVAMLASLIILAFAIAVNSYKDSRDAYWDRIGRLEMAIPEFRGTLTTFHSMRHMEIRLLNNISLSSYILLLTVFMTLLTVVVYIASFLGWRV